MLTGEVYLKVTRVEIWHIFIFHPTKKCKPGSVKDLVFHTEGMSGGTKIWFW